MTVLGSPSGVGSRLKIRPPSTSQATEIHSRFFGRVALRYTRTASEVLVVSSADEAGLSDPVAVTVVQYSTIHVQVL